MSFQSFMTQDKETKIRESIIECSMDQFSKYGIRSITMDDIANALGISKKTIYQYFKDKAELISDCTYRYIEKEDERIREMTKGARDVIEHLYLVTKCLRKNIKNINPVLIHELKKYYMGAWLSLHEFKMNSMVEQLNRVMTEGVQEGYFRKEINVDILSKLRLAQVEMSFDATLFPPEEYDLAEIHHQFFDHFVHGILTEKGLKLFKQYQNKDL